MSLTFNMISNEPNHNRIALTGKIRSGKDTVADYAMKKYGYIPFSLGRIVWKYYQEVMLGGGMKLTSRQEMQTFAQTMRQFKEDVWLHHLKIKLGLMSKDDRVIISDCRQPNEQRWFADNNYLFIRINADKQLRLQRCYDAGDDFNEEDLEHETEQYVDLIPVHFDIYNNGTIEEMLEQFDAIMKKYNAHKDYRARG